ncbi:MAG: ABC-F family ATP-binding cassette domain-containing protein [Spirochaetota bacterium]|nr:ABC-F family ATP-binding cassette domain-containing protein [Spirochaetota bacterium]
MISIDNLSKSYGRQSLLEGVSFKINPKERVGLVGRNGHGKTTLFRLIIGEEFPDDGNINIPKNYQIGYIQQNLDLSEDTVLKVASKGLPDDENDNLWKVEKVLSGLGFSSLDMQRHPEEFSGGFQVRMNLAKTLVSQPDMLLLDEPTNYLDITSIRWIERFLINWPSELMLITHDRSFMDKIVTHTIGIHRRKVRKITGNTEKLYIQIAHEEEIYEKTRVNDERRKKEVEQFINRFRAKARLANLVQSRIKTLEKMKKSERLSHIKTLDFSFQCKPFSGKSVLRASDVSFSYNPEVSLIKDFNIIIGANDRVCVIGKNGAGKSTLLRLLGGELKSNRGEVEYNSGVIMGFFEQGNISTLVDTRTIEEEILNSNEAVDRQMARDICGAMMFEGDDALKKIRIISGGEKSRVMLGKLLVKPTNLLILDEPTNHLDMESCDALLAAIDSYEGAVIIVTHNEMFLHALAQRLIVFKKDQISVFEGSYQRFLDTEGWDEEIPSSLKEQKNLSESAAEYNKFTTVPDKLNKKEARRRRSEIITERSRICKPLEQRIESIENEIISYEDELQVLTNSMQDASEAQDGTRISELSQSIHKSRSSIDILFNELEELHLEYNKQNSLFEKKLSQLEE